MAGWHAGINVDHHPGISGLVSGGEYAHSVHRPMIAVYILICGFCDRVAGGFPDNKLFTTTAQPFKNAARWLTELCYGIALTAPLPLTWWQRLLAGLAWLVGRKSTGAMGGTYKYVLGEPGWVWPLVQVGLVWPALTAAILAYWDLDALLLWPAALLGTFLSPLLAKPVSVHPALDIRTYGFTDNMQEIVRGMLIAGFFNALLLL